uniref:U15-Sparatoxin-Hju1a_1 n=1 Tax=Heteropoda jugulans TaxID=1358901 RepID=A0A4Q8K609_9ARAC
MLSLIFILLVIVLHASSSVDAEKCPDLYRRFSAQHTFCKPANKSCSIVKRGVSANDKVLIVKLHNEYRSKVATGQEAEGRYAPSS